MNKATLCVRWGLVLFLGAVGAWLVAIWFLLEWSRVTLQSAFASAGDSEVWTGIIVLGISGLGPLLGILVMDYRAWRADRNGGAQPARGAPATPTGLTHGTDSAPHSGLDLPHEENSGLSALRRVREGTHE